MKDKHVGVLLGGLSAEKEISIKSGEAMAMALEERGYAEEQKASYAVNRHVLAEGLGEL